MNIVIIEDEEIIANQLERSLIQLINLPLSITKLESVADGIEYFKHEKSTDLIFSDIQLGDGLSFEIFIAVPMNIRVIFCTAFDQYAMDAIKSNGIDYILKPFTTKTLQVALQKYTDLRKAFSLDKLEEYNTILKLLTTNKSASPTSILVNFADKIIPVRIEDIAIVYTANDIVYLLTFSGKTFYPNKNLDELESISGNSFFRVNRQFLVCRKTIIDVSSFFSRKLSLNLNIKFDQKIIVSKAKVASFLNWLSNT